MHGKKNKLNNIYTLTLLAGLTVNSIVRHVFQCTQAERFTLEELWHVVCELETRKQKLVFIAHNLASCPTPQKKYHYEYDYYVQSQNISVKIHLQVC